MPMVRQDRVTTKPKKSDLEFLRLLDKLPAAAYTCDAAGLITYFNAQAAQIWGRKPKLNDPADRYCGSFKLYSPDGTPVPHDQCWMARAITTNAEYNGAETVIERADQSRVTVLTHANPLHDPQGRVTGAVNVLMDITDQRRLEEQLRQSQKMAALGRLSSGIAHDFNNLLTVIGGYSEVIQSSLAPNDCNYPFLSYVRDAVEKATELTSQLLAFSRKQMLQPKLVNLNDIVRGCDKMLQRLIGQDIRFCCALSSLTQFVKVDPHQFEHVILNLAVNAHDAMPEGGQLLIETHQTRLSENDCLEPPGRKPGDFVVLTVTDTGCGMSAETLAQMFEPFFTTKEPGKGTGLGLAMAYGVVQQCGGFITCSSQIGEGTSFKIYLPALTPEQVGDHPVSQPFDTYS